MDEVIGKENAMRKNCRKKWIVFCLMIIFVLCGSIIGKQTVEAAALNRTKVTLIKGESVQLKVNGTTRAVQWSSSGKSVAVVTSKGRVTAKKKGTVKVTAKAGNKKYVCKVLVEDPIISQKNVTLLTGKSCQLRLSGTTRKVRWSSNRTDIAMVSSNGTVRGKKAGQAVITATVGPRKYNCTVTVKKAQAQSTKRKLVTEVLLNTGKVTMKKGSETSLEATVSPSSATNKKVKWSSSDTRVATVTSTGKVKAVQKGTVVITATAKDGSGKKASCEVTVTDEITDNIVGEAYAILPTTSKEGAAVGIRFRNNTGINICVDSYAVCANMEEDFIRKGYTVIDDIGVMFAEGYRKFSFDAYDEYEKNPTVTVEPGASREMFFEGPWGNYIRWDFTSSSYVLFDIIAGNECYLYKLDLTGTWKTYIEYTGYHCDVREKSTRIFDYVEDYNSNKVPDSSPSSPSDSSIKKVKIKEKCIFCHGSGKCGSCNGTGRLAAVTNRPNTCHACNSGRCGYCGGKGYTYDYDYIS